MYNALSRPVGTDYTVGKSSSAMLGFVEDDSRYDAFIAPIDPEINAETDQLDIKLIECFEGM